MTSSQHGDATVTIEVHDGALEAIIEIEGKRLVVADQQNRDLMLCLADLYPSLLPVREPARIVGTLGEQVHGYDNGIPVRTIGGQKACGCFVTDVCDCYAPPQTWGWIR